ncbi:MAG: TIGR04283 family arsenosugar biosynthesis glycosyltransferase [Bacteroidota bacterium]
MAQKGILDISIIIPVLNEASQIGGLLAYLAENTSSKEIIVVDGGSSDMTPTIVGQFNVRFLSTKKGRAKQMNFGASHAKGNVLYFLHADTLPPRKFDHLITQAIENGAESGCFRMKFDTKNIFLRFFAWLSRINHTLCRGGDQSLFITQNAFQRNKGFNEAYLIYEDSEFIGRLYKDTAFKVIPDYVITSARKYRQKGWLKVQYHFGMIHLKNHLGAKPEELYRYYHKNLLT